jgi:hypothetical protein
VISWRRLRRRTLAPRSPLLAEHHYGLALVTAIVLVGSIVAVVLIVAR